MIVCSWGIMRCMGTCGCDQNGGGSVDFESKNAEAEWTPASQHVECIFAKGCTSLAIPNELGSVSGVP